MALPGSRLGKSPPLIGREEIVEEVDGVLARAREGHGQGLLLEGENGSGKTHVLRALVHRGAARKFRVCFGHALPEELPSPFSLARSLLRSVQDEDPRAASDADASVPLMVGFAPIGEGHSELPTGPAAPPGPTVALDGLERILAPLGPGGTGRLGASREELVGWVEEYFLTLARDRPLVVAVDDLHLADTISLEVLVRLAIDLPEKPVVVIATVGIGAEVPERTRPLLEALGRSNAFRTVLLRPLSIPEVTDLARWICGGREPDPHDVLRWHAQTDGNPLFVEQLVRMATGYGATSGQTPAETSGGVIGILLARVRALDANDQRVLTYAAVLRKEFEFPDLVAVAGMEEERVTESLDRLVHDGLIRDNGHEVYEFVTEALRAKVYGDLTETRRRILHEKAGLALEAKGQADPAELARQFYLGRDHERTLRYSVAAAESATRAFAFETAADYLERALEAQRQRPERDWGAEVRLLTEVGRLFTEMGSPHRSEEFLREAVEVARAHDGLELELGRALLGLAQSRYERGEYTSSEALGHEAWEYLSEHGTRRDHMAAHRILGVVSWRRGNLAEAEQHQRAVLEIAEEEGTPFEQGHALIDVANLLVLSAQVPERYEGALDLYSRAAEIFSEGGNYFAQARALMNRAVLHWEAGHTDEALREFPFAIEASERARSPRWIGWCYFNLAQMLAELGRTPEARDALERAVRALAPVGDKFAAVQLILAEAMICQAERSFERSDAKYSEALDRARELGLPSDEAEILFRRAEMSHAKGDDAEARVRLSEAQMAGVLDHRPHFAPRIEALEASLAGSTTSGS